MSDDPRETFDQPLAPGAGEGPLPLAALLLDQRRRWQQGERVPVEEYLGQQPALGDNANDALDLIYNEVILREQDGETPRLEEYLERFPHLAEQLRVQFEVDRAVRSQELAPPSSSSKSPWPTLAPRGPQAKEPAALPRVGGYELLRELGRGGMGVVYQARQEGVNRLVAVKMILAGAYALPEQVARFKAEAVAVGRMQHPNIVQIYDVGEHEGRPFLVLEYVGGGGLDRRLGGTPQPIRPAAALVATLARAVHHAHQEGIVHRDLKPANVLLQIADCRLQIGCQSAICNLQSAIPKIADFGLAKHLDGDGGRTRSDAILGTPSYMAPEQAAGRVKEVGPATDVYALGAILYELLTGRPPFKAETPLETLRQVAGEEPVPPGRLRPRLARDLETICLKCLEKEARKRYASAQELGEELDRFLRHEPIRARPLGALARVRRWCRRNPILAAAGGLAGAALLAVAVVSTVFAVHTHHAAQELREEQRQTAQALADARSQRDRAEGQTRLAQRRLAEHYLDQAFTAFTREDDAGLGMLWLARALEAAPAGEADLEEAIRTNLACWASVMPSLRSILLHPGPVGTATFSPDGKMILTGGHYPPRSNMAARLWLVATEKRLGPPMPHQSNVKVSAFSPNGKTILTGSTDKTARLWSVATGKAVGPPLQHQDSVVNGAFSHDGKIVVTCSWDGTARLWQTATGQPLGRPLRHGGKLQAVAFSPDDKIALTGSRNSTARLWNVSTGQPLGPPLVHRGIVLAVAFSPNGKTALTGSGDGTAVLWSVSTGKALAPPLQHQNRVWVVAFSPNGKTVVTGSDDRTARLWDAATGQALGPPLVHRYPIRAVGFSPDSRTVLTASIDRTARLWDAATGQGLGPYLRHQGQVTAAAFHPDGKTFLTSSLDKTVRLWDVASGKAQRPVRQLQGPGSLAAFSPDGKTVLTLANNDAQLWSAATGKALGPLLRHRDQTLAAAFSPDGKVVLTGSKDKTAQRWSVATGQPVGPPLWHPTSVTAVAFSLDGKTLLTGSGKMAQLWSAATGAPIGTPLESPAGGGGIVAFSPDGKILLTSYQLNTVQLWAAASGKPIGQPLLHKDVCWTAVFSPDSKSVLTGSWDSTAQLWSAVTGKPIGPPLRHHRSVEAVAFSPDGKTILTGSWDHTARLWQASTGQGIGPPLQHQNRVMAVAFSPDGKTVATGSEDGTARLWQASSGRALGPPLPHRSHVRAVAFNPDGKTFLTVSADRVVRLWQVPAPIRGTKVQIERWAEVITGQELDQHGVARVLDPSAWPKHRQGLETLGGRPLRSEPE